MRELWVIDAAARRTFVHIGPNEKGWAEIKEKAPGETLICATVPDFAIKLGEI